MYRIQITAFIIDMQFIIFIFSIQWAAVCLTVTALEETEIEKDVPVLVIEPISSREYGLYVIKRVQDTLNLTCTIYGNSTDLEYRYNISWFIPSSTSNSKNRVVIQSFENYANLVVPHLEPKDEGEYECIAEPWDKNYPILTKTVIVNIKNRKKVCGDAMFTCSMSRFQNCIPQRYKCDGHQDCQMGEDEHHEVCGFAPCVNKLHCEDPPSPVVRCIPKSWCCVFGVDINCTVREPLSCCSMSYHKGYLDDRSYYATHQPHYTDMTIIQTTIYTVIGCAMVFMMVVTVLVIAICRVHMKRSLMTQCPAPRHQSTHLPENTPMYDLDVYLNRGCAIESLPPPACLVTYNINNGVQIVGHAIDPPPYCEVMCVPPREGPPPPYTSHEALDHPEAEALLQQSTTPHSLRIEEQQERRVVDEQESMVPEQEPTSSLPHFVS